MNRHLHIISPGTPYPADCGHSIDTFEKIAALHQSGVKVHLHSFHCSNHIRPELSNRCECLHAYTDTKDGSETANLVNKLNENDFPILVEDAYFPEVMDGVSNSSRKVVVRVKTENFCRDTSPPSFSEKLFNWPVRQKKAAPVCRNYLYACSSENDASSFREKYHLPMVEVLPPFVAWHTVKIGEGMGNFCLYHGDLSDAANEKMAIWLLEKVFSELKVPFIIAGKNPSRRIIALAHLYANACIVENPSKNEIDELIQKAHINIVPSCQPGKIYKLLHSLFEGRHCITNDMAVQNTGLASACHIANDSRSKIAAVRELMNRPFTGEEIEARKKLLLPRYDNRKNLNRLLDWLY